MGEQWTQSALSQDRNRNMRVELHVEEDEEMRRIERMEVVSSEVEGP